MKGLISAAFSRTGAVVLGLILLCGFGLKSYIDIPKEAKPDIDIPVAYVSVGYDGISPDDAERLLIKPLEKHLRTVEGLDKMSSVASEGYGSKWMTGALGVPPALLLAEVGAGADEHFMGVVWMGVPAAGLRTMKAPTRKQGLAVVKQWP